MSAELSAPAATSWKMKSGIRNAAKKLSSSAPAPNVVADDGQPDPAEDPRDRNAAVTMRPARASAPAARPLGHAGRSPEPAVARGCAARYAVRSRRRRDVGVDLGRRQALVAEQLLDDPQVRAAVEEVGREAVAQRVGRDALGQAGAPAQPLEPEAQAADARAAARGGSGRARAGSASARRAAARRRARRAGRPSAR